MELVRVPYQPSAGFCALSCGGSAGGVGRDARRRAAEFAELRLRPARSLTAASV
jgi:hypothetical protein